MSALCFKRDGALGHSAVKISTASVFCDMTAVVARLFVCRLSVCNVRAPYTQVFGIFGSVSTVEDTPVLSAAERM